MAARWRRLNPLRTRQHYRNERAKMAFTLNFLVRRLGQGVVVVLIVSFVIFALLRIIPGDPARTILGPMTPASVVEEKAREMGLRDPLVVQYPRYMLQVAQGDFGHSFVRGVGGGSTGGSRGAATHDQENRARVLDLILERLPLTLQLASLGVLFALIVSLPIGIYGGLNAGRWPDKLAVYLSSAFVSVPNIWLAVVFILIFSSRLGWLPSIGYRGFTYTILPAMVLAIELSPIIIRSLSVSVASNLQAPFVEVGVVRGISKSQMIRRHVLRNSAIPLLNLFGVQLAGILLGSLFIIEYIFNFPGIGSLTINAVFQRDFPIIQAVSILASAVLVFVNIGVDYISTLLDRRLQY